MGEQSTREDILRAAMEIVCEGRAQEYGGPEDSFGRIALLWSAYAGYMFEPKDVAAMMILLKVARIAGGSGSEDNWVDIAGYAACGGECLAKRRQEEAAAKWEAMKEESRNGVV